MRWSWVPYRHPCRVLVSRKGGMDTQAIIGMGLLGKLDAYLGPPINRNGIA